MEDVVSECKDERSAGIDQELSEVEFYGFGGIMCSSSQTLKYVTSSLKESLSTDVNIKIQELKDVLGQLGVSKTGRKQDLVDRIEALLSEEDVHFLPKNKTIRKEDVTKIIDDTYRKMQQTGANDPLIGGHCVSDSSSITPREEIVDQKIRCPCGKSLKTEFMIQCADPQCHVLQHIPCVVIPDESTEGVSDAPSQHYCELCRINRCDPFVLVDQLMWFVFLYVPAQILEDLGHPLDPVKLLVSSIPDDGTPPLQNVETTFQITKANVHMLEGGGGYDVQAWCILLNDSVPFRMQWPQFPDLKVNGIPVKTINRPGSKMLGANGRDDGPSISLFLVDGCNRISLCGTDARSFCLGVRLVKQRTVQQVINMIPGEQEGESFADAVARVCRCIGGGMAAANDDSDSDLEILSQLIYVALCNEIEVKSDGSWRAKTGRPFMDLERWHFADGSLSVSQVKVDPNIESEHQLAINANGHRGVSDAGLPQSDEYIANYGQEIISMSSGSSDNMQEDGFESTSQYDIATNKEDMMDCAPYNYNQMSGITNRSSSSLGDPSVIVLSDSEEENDPTVSATRVPSPGPPNGSPETPVTHSGEAVLPAGSLLLSGEVKAESGQMSNSKRQGVANGSRKQ
ncbi:hypothetical protein OSB04_017749, partial [Centaurea solstitialis]